MADVTASEIQKADAYLNWLILQYLKDHDKSLQNICIIDLMQYSHSRAAKYVSRKDIKRIKKLFAETDESLYYSTIAEKLDIDLSLVVEICNKLIKTGLIERGKPNTLAHAASIWKWKRVLNIRPVRMMH